MEKMLVVVFDNEAKAYEGTHALRQLDAEGSIAIHGVAVVKKNADGTITVKHEEDEFPIRAVGGTAIGALIGLLEGPVGMAVGSVYGALAGSIGDLHVAGVDAEFVGEASDNLKAGKCAVVADVSEEWVTPVDVRMEALGGVVFRKPRRLVEEDERAKDAAELRAEIDQLKAEIARAHGERKAKLTAKLDKLDAKLQATLDEAAQSAEQFKRETDAKVEALQKKAAKTQGESKATMDARVNEIREQYREADSKVRHLLADGMREAAARLEK